MVEPKAFQDALLAYHARPCDPEAEAVRAAVLQWQPIETAPKDGTVIGSWSPREPGIIRRVRWGHHLGIKKHAPTWNTASRGLAISNVPTHWIALPPLPGETSDGVLGTEGRQE